MKLYDYRDSGNGYKVRLLLSHLDVDYEYIPVDIMRGETRTSEFLEKNPNGRIPTLELDDGSYLPESNAIMFFLAEGTPYLPDTGIGRARVLQWLFFEQYSHEPNVAVLRFWARHFDPSTIDEAQRADKIKRGNEALAVMERHLENNDYLVGEKYSIADIGLYAYTHVAEDGGLSLAPYPSIDAWLARVAAQPGHVPMLD